MLRMHRWEDLDETALRRLCGRNSPTDAEALELCREVFAAVRSRGDASLKEFSQRFDGVSPSRFRVPPEMFDRAWGQLNPESRQALTRAARNIEIFHRSQLRIEPPVSVEEGIECWRESRPIESVGLYVPGGNAVLPSTALMLGIPARLAGCRRVAVCVPPRGDGSVTAEVLAAARLAGVDEVYALGGAHAIAALAVGTESVPRVDKIFGPGSRLVQCAKLTALWNGCQIDLMAGPSEVLVIADSTASPEFVAADLLSQVEHGADSQAILVATSPRLVREVEVELLARLAPLRRRQSMERALAGSFAVVAPGLDEAFEFSNRYAPEHLILHVDQPRGWVAAVKAAGSVFLGPWSPEVAGDYASGTNHTLPTSGAARAASGVSVESFLNRVSFQELNADGLARLAPTLVELARMEGLEAHAQAVLARTRVSENATTAESGMKERGGP